MPTSKALLKASITRLRGELDSAQRALARELEKGPGQQRKWKITQLRDEITRHKRDLKDMQEQLNRMG